MDGTARLTFDVLYFACIVVVWSCNPLLRRAVTQRMETEEGDDTAASFVAMHSLFSTTAAFSGMVASGKHARFGGHLRHAGAAVLLADFAGASVAIVASYLLTTLVRRHNPGTIIAALNSSTTIVVFVTGMLLYSKLSMRGTAGAAMCAIGMYLMKT